VATRDITKTQFKVACERRGFKSSGFLGYYDIGHGTSVSVLNAGDNRRARLAYLIQEHDKAERRCESEGCIDHPQGEAVSQ